VTERVALCEAREIAPSGQVPDLVHLLPAGGIRARDGRRFRLSDAASVIKASLRGHDLVIDYEHQSEDAGRRGADGVVPAAGWITDLVERANGLWGRVVWTARARAMIAAREYRYLSPTFFHDKDGTVLRIKGAGLVHDPALELTALARQEASMSDLSRIAAALDLEPDAGVDTILTALARQEPDPAKYVPLDAVKDLLRERAERAATLSAREAEARVDRAVESGYVTPGMRDWALSLCRKDPASFDQFLAGAVPIAGSTNVDWTRPPGGRTAPAGEEATAICAQLGLTPDQLKD
jgi:phage I-like protein